MVILHVIIAFASLAAATASVFHPNKTKLLTSYGFIAATLLSGVVLVVAEPSRMLHVCVAGLLYVTVASALTVTANIRLVARQKGKAEA